MLDGKVIVVTGGAGVIGRAFCRALASAGAKVIIAERDLEAAEALATTLNAEFAGKAAAYFIDITDKASITALINAAEADHGWISGLVNNAYPRNPRYGRGLEDVTYDDFVENTGMHLGGYFLSMQQFSLYFKTQGGGSIVNMSSIYGVMAPRFDIYAGTSMTMPVEYAAIKSGILHLTSYFAQNYKKVGLRVNAISPGGIADAQPASFLAAYNTYCGQKGMLDASDLAGTLIYLLSDQSQYVTGQNIIVDDGFSL